MESVAKKVRVHGPITFTERSEIQPGVFFRSNRNQNFEFWKFRGIICFLNRAKSFGNSETGISQNSNLFLRNGETSHFIDRIKLLAEFQTDRWTLCDQIPHWVLFVWKYHIYVEIESSEGTVKYPPISLNKSKCDFVLLNLDKCIRPSREKFVSNRSTYCLTWS